MSRYAEIDAITGVVLREYDRPSPARSAAWRYQDKQRSEGGKSVHYHNHYPAARKSRRRQAGASEVATGLVLAMVTGVGIIVITR